jgi:UDP-3-O-[3-hydroxymyristoyl] glucosamine N-acyltransferase
LGTSRNYKWDNNRSKGSYSGSNGVTKSVEGGKSYFGTPIEESREKLKQLANIKKIPEILIN